MKSTILHKKHRTVGLTAILSTLSIVIIFLCFFMVERSNQMIHKETGRYLSEISQQSADKVNQRIEYNLDIIQSTADALAILENQSPALSEEYVSRLQSNYSFLWMGIIDSDTNIQAEGMSEQDASAIQAALNGTSSTGPRLITDSNGEKGIIYATPYIVNGKVRGALVGWSDMAAITDLLSAETFGGQGFSHIIDREGNFILRSNNPNAVLSSNNLFDSLKGESSASDNMIEQMEANIAAGKTGHLHLHIDGSVEEEMNYIPLNAEGWYLISVAPSGVYSASVNSFTKFAIALTITIFLIFTLLILIIVRLDNKKNAEIAKVAFEDPITGGFTSPRLDLELNNMFKNFKPFTFVSLDIRKFKLINDSFGSNDGNQVLKYLHNVIKKHLKSGEYVSRVSADVFNFILLSTSAEEIQKRIQEIVEDLNSFNENMDAPYYLPVDCGIYIVTEPETDIITIRDRSNTARKVNKKSRSTKQRLMSCVFYSDMERQQLQKEKVMENNMERALKSDEFVVYFQPKVDLSTNQVVGAEALVRWQTPDRGLIPPNDFIPFFEKNGFILKVDLYVFEKVCQAIHSWIEQGLKPVPISVNLSRVHLRVPNFLEEFKAIQERYSIPPELLEIELTETMVFENLEFLKQVIDEIHDIGFRCSMDDFGSGYSSLNVLKDVPVDILKLDKVFFDSSSTSRGNDVIESVIQLAKKLGMVTISEGVETLPQVEFLKEVNCDIVQGYIFSRPVPLEDFEKMVYF